MSKTVIVGITNSGKTCYFYGMLRKMMRGYHGFSIRVAEKDFASLRTGIKRLGDTKLPVGERFPVPSSMQEEYEMDLLYNLKKLDSFKWVDYPGELAESGNEEFINLLDGATCLLLCVDGTAIQGTEDNIDDIVDSIYNDKGGLELCNALQQAERKYENGFPPVCILITKYDEVSPELRNMELLTEIMKESFPILFHEGNGKSRMVTICPVTLGKEIMEGGKLDPKNVEKPICFANYLIQASILENVMQQAKSFITVNQQEVEKYKRKNVLHRLISKKPEPLTEEQKQAIGELINKGKEDLDALRGVIEALPLYINGVKTDWPD